MGYQQVHFLSSLVFFSGNTRSLYFLNHSFSIFPYRICIIFVYMNITFQSNDMFIESTIVFLLFKEEVIENLYISDENLFRELFEF